MASMPKYIIWNDIHIGAHRNSTIHNEDCLEFIRWSINIAKENDVTEFIFQGDFHENRSSIDSSTLNYSQTALELINEGFTHTYFIVGNHDNYKRNSDEVNSLPHTRPLLNIELIDKPIQHGDILFVPWLFTKAEYKEVLSNTDARIVCGHFEFNDFVVAGSNYKMDHGVDARYFTKPELILSGHYHARQRKGNVQYVGNTFPTSFSDVNDTHRGCCILDTDKSGDEMLQFFDWADAPQYIRCTLSELLDTPDKFLSPKATVECTIDLDLSYVDAMELRKDLIETYQLRSLSMPDDSQAARDDAVEADIDVDISLGDMNGMVLTMLAEVKSDSIDNKLLAQIYGDL